MVRKNELNTSVQLLRNTPKVLNALLHQLDARLIYNNEGKDTWSAFDVVGHLIVCEQTNFLPRIKLTVSDGEPKQLAPIDMSAQFENSKGKTITDLLKEFAVLREQNLAGLVSLHLSPDDFDKQAVHPKLGTVTLNNLLSTWVAHDLTHIAQITRVMAKQYKEDTGPFIEFLSRLN